VVNYIKGVDHWIAMLLLGYVGINLIRAGFKKDGQAFNQDPSTGRILVLLSFATSNRRLRSGVEYCLIENTGFTLCSSHWFDLFLALNNRPFCRGSSWRNLWQAYGNIRRFNPDWYRHPGCNHTLIPLI
jgi:hypothetical protein